MLKTQHDAPLDIIRAVLRLRHEPPIFDTAATRTRKSALLFLHTDKVEVALFMTTAGINLELKFILSIARKYELVTDPLEVDLMPLLNKTGEPMAYRLLCDGDTKQVQIDCFEFFSSVAYMYFNYTVDVSAAEIANQPHPKKMREARKMYPSTKHGISNMGSLHSRLAGQRLRQFGAGEALLKE
ncbi:hypothetical protein CAEBREN_15462 [Caenorhabditis brenneri]|uniref:Uncharacterized protein n=1 Tax=Caenorhabditis brenneri TaxID=135651 RepID=G0MJ57_CAEBE|nr:hypothetical protein CAEBREN_15462 [Caenorhabditis brenneri]